MTAPQRTPEAARWIRPLPPNVVNKIAAGEVVERPAAVLKELVENAIDAGAKRIDIEVEKAGIKLIRIVDNGCGISEEQLEIAFGRHATSKITQFKDLDALYTYGFRGEALPSIASVSQLRMVSRTRDASAGAEIVIEGGVVHSKGPIAAPVGTTVEVRNLFFNTPARRKFLRAESTENRYLSRTATALALGRRDLGFSYRTNGRQLFSVPAEQPLIERVEVLLSAVGKLVPVDGTDGPVRVTGCLGLPEMAQHNRFAQYLFVNGRYIHSPVLSHAVRAAYGEMIPGGSYPIGSLLVTIDPAELDVNVHPSKTEIRMSREREVHDAVRRVVRNCLRQDGIIPAFSQPAQAGTGGIQSGSSGPPAQREMIIPGVYQQAQPMSERLLDQLHQIPAQGEPTPDVVQVDTRTGEVLDQADSDMPVAVAGPSDQFRMVGRFSDRYLLLQSGDNLYVVDQHTAHERVLYEQFLDKLDGSSLTSQHLLLPVQVELSPEQLAVFEGSTEWLDKSGFVVSPFGGRLVNIEAVPMVLSKKSPSKLILGLLDDLADMRKAGGDILKRMAQSMACRAAVMAGDHLSDTEATDLLVQLQQCRDKYTCPHGRPTYMRISRRDLDKQFGRE